MPDGPRPVDSLSRHELALLWNDCITSDPELFAPHKTEAPPLVPLRAMELAYNEGAYWKDDPLWPSRRAYLDEGHG